MNQNLSGNSEQTPVSSQAVVERTDRTVTETSDPIYHHTEDRAKLRLQKALDCLDVKLEDELSRFRARQAHRSIDTPPTIGTVAWEPHSVGAPAETDENVIVGEIVKSKVVVGETVTRGGKSTSGMDEMTPPNANPRLATMANVNDRPSLYADYTEAENATTAENLDVNFSLRGEIAPFHVGYLASSQELLDREQIEATDESNDVFEDPADSYKVIPQPRFFTFRKLGLMVMAWAVAGGAAYAYFNPNILALLTAKVIAPIATTSSVEQSIQSPNLAANEFTELNLSTVNTIKLPTATTATTVTPTTTTASVANPSVAPVAIPYQGTNATTAMPQPAPITAQPQLADSLVKSLLPPNFHNFAKRVRTTQAMRTGQ
jgi:hypothetical protein